MYFLKAYITWLHGFSLICVYENTSELSNKEAREKGMEGRQREKMKEAKEEGGREDRKEGGRDGWKNGLRKYGYKI